MDQWKKFTSNVASNVGPQFQNIGKTFGNLNQQARERFGAVDQEDITELPQEYKDLERRVDALKSAHTGLMKVAKVYETESYDYPVCRKAWDDVFVYMVKITDLGSTY